MEGHYSSRLARIFLFHLLFFVTTITCFRSFELLRVLGNISKSEGQPTFESSFESIPVEEGSKMEMNCTAAGKTPITYQWFKNEDEVSENSLISISKSTIGSTLSIQNIQKSHEGNYVCTANNEYGLSSKVFDLTVHPSLKNDTVSILEVKAVNVTSNSVVFSINDITGLAGSVTAKYSEERGNTEWTTTWQPYRPGRNYEVKNLIPSGSYTFEFRSDRSEDGKWFALHKIVLLPDTPEVIFQGMEGGNLKIQWFRKTDDVLRGTIDRYELSYFSVQMQGGNSWIQRDCAITILLPSCSSPSYAISGLSYNVFYEIQLRAHTVSGYGEPYKQKIFFPR